MKFFTLSLTLFVCFGIAKAQNCIEPSLIDPNAICVLIYDPVCGCDGVTYSNACVAENNHGVTSYTQGECPFNTSWCLDMSGVDFGDCDQFLGYGYVDGQCVPISGCGTTGSNGYNYSLFLHPTPEQCENACSNLNDCKDPDLATGTVLCSNEYEPICGCDGVTYTNICQAVFYGTVTSWTHGECPTTQESCLDLTDVDFGLCDQFLGYGYVNGQCVPISGCGTTGSNGFNYSDYLFDSPEECELACSNVNGCIDPDLIGQIQACPNIYDPVCGCDGITYTNACRALRDGGVTSWTQGECPGLNEPCLNLTDVDFGDCDQFLGYGRVGDVCTAISGCSTVGDNGFDYADYLFDTIEECANACSNFQGCVDPDLMTQDPCPQNYDPVCGCDGVTYFNLCRAFRDGGVTEWTDGPCPFECFDPELLEIPICTEEFDPVCGCDGITYSNPCHAQQQGGNTAWSDGPCQDTDEDGTPDVLDCAMFDPYVYPGASCDDNDENTINDKYNDCCICEGAPLNEPNECASDLNNDGFANAADLLLFLAGFGAVCE